MILPIHILAGGMALVTGYAALFAGKGGRLHRRGGVLFVYAMAVMGLSAGVLYALQGEPALGGLLPAYLVVTALTTVRPRTVASRRVDAGCMLVACALAAGMLARAVAVLATPGGTEEGVPDGSVVLLAVVMLLAAVGDVRMIRAGGLRGAPRLARHLWRMCFALFMATGSFFLGQADEIPARLRVWPILAILAFLPLLAMAYWTWRVRAGKPVRAVAAARPPARAAPALAGEPSR